ncbi:nucleotide exchange factor GrpE [Candidatus Gracilibacteria bacterium]|nr:nucleotide exchange factor GrpE [Candidatus Gracilibacteria bacterium]
MTPQDTDNTQHNEEEVLQEESNASQTDDGHTSDDTTESIQIETLQQKIASLEESLARKQADYQNLQMRSERERTEMAYFLTEKLITPLLSQIDNLERAIATKDGIEGDAFVDGVKKIHEGLEKYLSSHNIQAFDSVGQEIDPDKHDVLSQMPGKEGFVVQEFEKGYMLGDKILRHAKVIAGSGEE